MFALGLYNESISPNLCVDPSTIHIVTRFSECGNVTKKDYPKDCRETKLTKYAELIILNMVLQKPGVYLREMQEELSCVYGVDVHESTLCKFLKKWIYETGGIGFHNQHFRPTKIRKLNCQFGPLYFKHQSD